MQDLSKKRAAAVSALDDYYHALGYEQETVGAVIRQLTGRHPHDPTCIDPGPASAEFATAAEIEQAKDADPASRSGHGPINGSRIAAVDETPTLALSKGL